MTSSDSYAQARIEPFDAGAASDDKLRPYHDLAVEIDIEERPDEPPYPFEELCDDVRHVPAHRVNRRWVARGDDGVVLASAGLHYALRDENQDQAYVHVRVRPSARRRGLGLTMIQPALEEARKQGRTTIGLESLRGGPGIGFLSALGATQKRIWRESDMTTKGIDRALLESWVERAKERAADYELLAWDQRTPAEHVQAFCDLTNVMNTAPREDYEEDDWINTPQLLLEGEQSNLDAESEWWTLVARHRTSGEFAGYTQIHFPRWRPWLAWQGDTGVDPAHRNHGLGRRLKASLALRLLDERPAVETVRTWNAGSNEAMLNINVAMGFAPKLWWTEWQAPLDTLEQNVKERLA
ncbi:MAG TPA: GNAT family N-acetyltransferase [Acidimicrobiales bacterium]|nr:GNAT family N-acetyltransferase [Acidimicrobiales bacterium]